MKKNLFLIFAAFLLLAVPSLRADDISPEKARAAAETFFSQSGVDTRSGSALTMIGTDLSLTGATRGSQPAYYIFNRAGGGFVIISALDAAVPVLGYSFEHSFSLDEDMPDNLRSWLSCYSEQIASRRTSGKAATAQELARWDAALTRTRGGNPPASIDLQTADWGQGAPYNNKCPLDTLGKRSIVGCVATAISEYLYYFKYPVRGTGTLPSYTKNKITVGPIALGEEYRWDLMIPKYKGASYTTEQSDAVATLCFHVGVMAKMSYGSSASAASTATGVEALTQYMGFDKGIVKQSRSYNSAEQWRALMKNQLQDSIPVLFAGSSESGSAHAFIVDGYDEADRFLINFGWNGSSNGYYQLDAFGSYTVTQTVYLAVVPEKGGSEEPNLYLRKTTQSGVTYNGLVPYAGAVSVGSTFTARFGAVYNYGFTKFEGKINFAHMDKEGNIKSLLRSADLSLSLSDGTYTWWSSYQSLKITAAIERGDRAVPVYRRNDSEAWRTFGYTQDEGFQPELPLHIRDYTSLEYDKAKTTLTLKSFYGVTWTLTNAESQTVGTGSVPTAGKTDINLSAYPAGTYTLSLTLGTQAAEITLTL